MKRQLYKTYVYVYIFGQIHGYRISVLGSWEGIRRQNRETERDTSDDVREFRTGVRGTALPEPHNCSHYPCLYGNKKGTYLTPTGNLKNLI